jgi:hypothetical protein
MSKKNLLVGILAGLLAGTAAAETTVYEVSSSLLPSLAGEIKLLSAQACLDRGEQPTTFDLPAPGAGGARGVFWRCGEELGAAVENVDSAGKHGTLRVEVRGGNKSLDQRLANLESICRARGGAWGHAPDGAAHRIQCIGSKEEYRGSLENVAGGLGLDAVFEWRMGGVK